MPPTTRLKAKHDIGGSTSSGSSFFLDTIPNRSSQQQYAKTASGITKRRSKSNNKESRPIRNQRRQLPSPPSTEQEVPLPQSQSSDSDFQSDTPLRRSSRRQKQTEKAACFTSEKKRKKKLQSSKSTQKCSSTKTSQNEITVNDTARKKLLYGTEGDNETTKTSGKSIEDAALLLNLMNSPTLQSTMAVTKGTDARGMPTSAGRVTATGRATATEIKPCDRELADAKGRTTATGVKSCDNELADAKGRPTAIGRNAYERNARGMTTSAGRATGTGKTYDSDATETDDDDDDWRLTNSRRSEPKHIEMLDSSDDEDKDSDSDSELSRPGLLSFNIRQYSINGVVYDGDSSFNFNVKHKRLSIVDSSLKKKRMTRKLEVENLDSMEVKYSIAEEGTHRENFELIDSIMAFDIPVRNVQGSGLSPPLSLSRTGHTTLVVEFPRDSSIYKLKKVLTVTPKRMNSFVEISDKITTLMEHAVLELARRKSNAGASVKLPKNFEHLKDADILFTYPFPRLISTSVSETRTQAYEAACKSLKELKTLKTWNDGIVNETRTAGLVDITFEHYKKLAPGIWLNCNLINLWMLWITRDLPSDVQVFNSYFYTKLRDSGPKEVESWTKKKRINIFEKRMIFIPINSPNCHWSLCVLVNPGAFVKSSKYKDLSPSLIFMDSMAMHSRAKIEPHIIGWLNSECRRLGLGGNNSPFQKKTLYRFSPKVPIQMNGCDCGVFVLKYAYATYQQKSTLINYSIEKNREGKHGFLNLFQKSEHFNFRAKDMQRIRREFSTLIRNVANLRWKEEEKCKSPKQKSKTKSLPTKSTNHSSLGKKHNNTTNNMLPLTSAAAASPFVDITTPEDKYPLEDHGDDGYRDKQVNWAATSTSTKTHRPFPGILRPSSTGLTSDQNTKHATFDDKKVKVAEVTTKYSRTHLDPRTICDIPSDLDNNISHSVWIYMPDLARMAYVLTRISLAEAANGDEAVASHRSQNQLQVSQALAAVGHCEFDGQQQQALRSTADNLNAVANINTPNTPTGQAIRYITMVAPTPQRSVLAKHVGGTAKSQIKRSDAWLNNLEATSQNPHAQSLNAKEEEVVKKTKDGNAVAEAKSRKRKIPTPKEITGVYKASNRKKLLRAGTNFMTRHNIDMYCESQWPQTHAVYMVYNELTRNIGGSEKMNVKKRDMPQLNFLASSDAAIANFKTIFPVHQVDTTKYDVAFTVDPEAWVGRLAEEAGEKLSRGTDADPTKAFSRIEEQQNNSEFTPRK